MFVIEPIMLCWWVKAILTHSKIMRYFFMQFYLKEEHVLGVAI